MSDATSDRALVAAFLATREERAFRDLYRRYTPRLFRVAVRLTNDRGGVARPRRGHRAMQPGILEGLEQVVHGVHLEGPQRKGVVRRHEHHRRPRQRWEVQQDSTWRELAALRWTRLQ